MSSRLLEVYYASCRVVWQLGLGIRKEGRRNVIREGYIFCLICGAEISRCETFTSKLGMESKSIIKGVLHCGGISINKPRKTRVNPGFFFLPKGLG